VQLISTISSLSQLPSNICTMAGSRTFLVLFAIFIGLVSSTSLKSKPFPLQICTRPRAYFRCPRNKPPGNFFEECGLYKKGEACTPFCSYLLSKAMRCYAPRTTFEEYRPIFMKCISDCDKAKIAMSKKRNKRFARVYVTNKMQRGYFNCAVCRKCHIVKCVWQCYVGCW